MANFDELDAEKRQQIIRDYLLNKEAEKVQDVGPSLEDQKSDLAWQEIAQRAAYAGQDKSQDIQNAFNQKRQSLDTDYSAGLKAKREARRQQFSDVMDVEKLEQQKVQNEQARLDRIQREEASRQEKDLARQAKADETKRIESKLSDKQVEQFNDFDTAQKDLNNMLGLLGKNQHYTGPIDALIPDKLLIGGDQVAWRSAVGKYKDAYRKAITGTGASPGEITILESRLPSESDSYKDFVAKAQEAQKDIERKRQSYGENLSKSGKDVSSFIKPKEIGTVDVMSPSGADKEAVTWATANFNSKDPITKNKAAEILRVNGIINSSVGAR
jgi:hypothetical protein